MTHNLWTMENNFINIWKVILLMDGMDIVLEYLFTIITGHKLRNSFVKRIVPASIDISHVIYMLYCILYVTCYMVHKV